MRPMGCMGYSQRKAPLGAFFIVCFLWLALLPAPLQALCALEPGLAVETVQIESVFDGDTVRLVDGRKVRLVGINTPEVAHGGNAEEPLALQAKDQLQALLSKKPIRLLQGSDQHDRYGRVLGHLFDREGNSLIAALLQQGMGFQVAIEPNLRYVDCYAHAQQQARMNARGVWGHDYYAAIPATSDRLRPGYARVEGQVESVELSKRAVFVELAGQVTLKVERNAAPYIDSALLDRLVAIAQGGKPEQALRLEARGWLSDRLTWNGNTPALVRQGQRKRYQMKVTHQTSWQVLPPG